MQKYPNTDLTDIYNYINEGDILQYTDSGGMTQHTQIVYTKYATGQIYVAQHSSNTFWWLTDYVNSTPRMYLSAIRIKAAK